MSKLIKHILRDNTGTGLFILFMSQAYIHALRFWANRIYILGVEYDKTLINQEIAQIWSAAMKEETEAAKALLTL